MIVYVVTGESGEYSSTRWWVTGVFRDREMAEAHIREILDEWARIGPRVAGWDADDEANYLPGLHDEHLKPIETKIFTLDPRCVGAPVVMYGPFEAPRYAIEEMEMPTPL